MSAGALLNSRATAVSCRRLRGRFVVADNFGRVALIQIERIEIGLVLLFFSSFHCFLELLFKD
ncbi:MAG TPA: hypothetical protein VFP47_07125, partial [Pyrinomonadaceae bacterium]|nr:hypothetical protein [Pyrinomonadaceae bacterium]